MALRSMNLSWSLKYYPRRHPGYTRPAPIHQEVESSVGPFEPEMSWTIWYHFNESWPNNCAPDQSGAELLIQWRTRSPLVYLRFTQVPGTDCEKIYLGKIIHERSVVFIAIGLLKSLRTSINFNHGRTDPHHGKTLNYRLMAMTTSNWHARLTLSQKETVLCHVRKCYIMSLFPKALEGLVHTKSGTGMIWYDTKLLILVYCNCFKSTKDMKDILLWFLVANGEALKPWSKVTHSVTAAVIGKPVSVDLRMLGRRGQSHRARHAHTLYSTVCKKLLYKCHT